MDSVKIDEQDRHLLDAYNWKKWRARNGVYIRAHVGRNAVLLHRLITKAPPGMVVDHINGDTLDNRRGNLRVCTRAENSRGQHARRGVSRFKGVYFHAGAGKWAANIRANRKLHYLGLYEVEEDAARAYDEAALKFFGEYAVLNLPPAE